MKVMCQFFMQIVCIVIGLTGVLYPVHGQSEMANESGQTQSSEKVTSATHSLLTSVIPFSEVENNLFHKHRGPVLSILFDQDKRPVRLLMDTGAGSLLKESFTKQRKLFVVDAAKLNDRKEELGLDEAWEFIKKEKLTVVEEMKLGKLVLHSNPFLVVRDSDLSTFPSVDGVLGLEMFGGTAVRIDYQKKEVSFFDKGELSQTELTEYGFASPEVIILKMTYQGGQFVVPVTVGGKERNLTVDTGSFLTIVEAPQKDFPNAVVWGKRNLNLFRGKTLSGPEVETTLSLGQVEYDKTVIMLVSSGDLPNEGVLGMDILSQFDVLMDFPGKKLYLKPLKKEAKKP